MQMMREHWRWHEDGRGREGRQQRQRRQVGDRGGGGRGVGGGGVVVDGAGSREAAVGVDCKGGVELAHWKLSEKQTVNCELLRVEK